MHNIHQQTRYEKLILCDGTFSREVQSVLAGASRASRANLGLTGAMYEEVAPVATGVLAPINFLYAAWLLWEARERGIERLYFLARDGFLIKVAAEVLSQRWGIEIDLRYLHASREAWFLPSFKTADSFSFNWITWGYLGSISIEEIEKRLQQPAGFLWSQLENHPKFFNYNVSQSLTVDQLEAVRILLEDDGVTSQICLRADSFLENVRGYFEGQGIFDDVTYALVDTGWKGTSQYAFSLILEKLGRRPASGVSGFYLGLNRNHWLYGNDTLNAFLFDWNRTGIDYRIYNFLCFEMLFSAKDGRTLGYKSSSFGYAPIIENKTSTENFMILDTHFECVKLYVDFASRVLTLDDLKGQGANLCRKLAAAFISNPKYVEAEAYGCFMIAGEIGERDMQPVAPKMTYSVLLLMILKKVKIKGFWPQGSMVRSKMRVARVLYCMFLDLKLLDWYRRLILKY